MTKGNEKNEALDVLIHLHSKLADYTILAQTGYRRLEITLIVLSAITTGAFWSLLAGIMPTLSLWVGAVVSTLVTILSAYKETLGPQEAYKRAVDLYRETGELLAQIRSSDKFDGKLFWHKYKLIQSEMLTIEWIRKGRKGRLELPE